MLPLIGTTRFIERVPAFVRTGLGGTMCEVELVGPTSALLSFDGPHVGSSAVMAGVLDECFERMHVNATLTAHQLGGTTSSLDVRWDA